MQSETDWLAEDTEARAAYKFFMRTDPEMRELLGPIETVDDPFLGRPMRTRQAKIAMMRGMKADRPVTVYLDPTPHIRLDAAKPLLGWYGDAHPKSPRERVRPCYSEAILTEPYGGMCPVNCQFCYVNAGVRGYKGSGLMTVPLDYGQQVKAMLGRMRKATAGYWSSFTDPFQPLEDVYHNTQRSVEAFDAVGLPVFFLSRRPYPGWAFDVLTRNRYSYAQKSINTPDPEDWKKLSPGALPLLDHMDEIRELKRRGIYVSIQVNPVVAGITTHDDVEALFEMLAEAGADHVIVKFVEAGYSWAPAMVDRMTKAFGDNRAAAFRDLFVQNIGGQKTVAEEYRMEGHRRYRRKATSLGLTYAVCFEFKTAPGTSGVSVGPEFMTSDQCHGRRVPMFTRLSTDVPFSEVEACPPTGCLSCASDNGGAPRCGNDLLGQAKALRAADYREPVM